MTTLDLALHALLWGGLGLFAHTYAVYPLMMRLLSRGRKLPEERYESDDDLPEVAVLMSVYNEESVLEPTLASILSSDYPRGKLRLFIGSDGSTDASEDIVGRFAADDGRLRLVRFGGRNGKTRIVNRLAEEAAPGFSDPDGALFVLCDANVVWTPDLLRRLASHFRRGSVGLVAPAVSDRICGRSGIGQQEEAYVSHENIVKFAEGVLWGRVMGAFGACYAMRAGLFVPVPPQHLVDDFYQTLSVLEQGKDAIVDLDAVCHEAVSTDIREEFRRKRRIATGNFQNLRRFWSFLLPWNGGPATSFAFWSHKGLRWCGPLLLGGAFLGAAGLAALRPHDPLHWLPLAGFAVALAMSLADLLLAARGGGHVRILRFVRYLLAMNLAVLLGFVDFLRGPATSVWEPTRREGGERRASSASPRRPEPVLRR